MPALQTRNTEVGIDMSSSTNPHTHKLSVCRARASGSFTSHRGVQPSRHTSGLRTLYAWNVQLHQNTSVFSVSMQWRSSARSRRTRPTDARARTGTNKTINCSTRYIVPRASRCTRNGSRLSIMYCRLIQCPTVQSPICCTAGCGDMSPNPVHVRSHLVQVACRQRASLWCTKVPRCNIRSFGRAAHMYCNHTQQRVLDRYVMLHFTSRDCVPQTVSRPSGTGARCFSRCPHMLR